MSSSFESLIDFLDPINIYELSDDEGYKETQLGKHIALNDGSLPDISGADLVLVGCNEARGSRHLFTAGSAPDEIRKAFYNLYHWHNEVSVADIGNIKTGSSIDDTLAALRTVIIELIGMGKRVVILGGSHDITRAQYSAYAGMEKIIDMVCVDARIDIDMDSRIPEDNFLLKMLTGDPNFINHYNHIGFQSYFVHPAMLETIDELRFDCFRVGRVKECMEEMEPVIRNSHLFSFDISAIQNAHAPANRLTPNGFTGEEACKLMQYAGMSFNANSIGIYGYNPANDNHALTAMQISHMLWYLMDGIHKSKKEAPLTNREEYLEFHLAFAEMDTVFLQSKKTGRWWMKLPDDRFIACSHQDYIQASNNEIPERWLRAVERTF